MFLIIFQNNTIKYHLTALSVGKLEAELYYSIIVEDMEYTGSLSYTMFDGFKLFDNTKVFEY